MRSDLRLAAAMAIFALSAVPAAAEAFRLEKQFDLAPGDRFELRSEVGAVTLRGIDGRQASIVVTSGREDMAQRFDIRFDQSGGGLRMTVERREGALSRWLSWLRNFNSRAQIAIDLPRATPIDLRTSGGSIDISSLDASVNASSSGGSVKIADVRGDVTLSSSGGGVTAQNVGGPVSADTSGGSLVIDTVSGGVTASSSGGGVEIRAAGGRVRAGSSGGSVRVSFAAGNAQGGDINSSGGGVAVALDSAARLDVDAVASGGPVRCDLPVTVQGGISRNSLHGKINGGGALLKLRSSGGGITIGTR
jgi:DUF4097 and DUF4098 domain-containing protein YvlB